MEHVIYFVLGFYHMTKAVKAIFSIPFMKYPLTINTIHVKIDFTTWICSEILKNLITFENLS